MSADLATRLHAGRSAVVLSTEVADALAVTDDRARELMNRVRPLQTPGPRGVARFLLGALLDADTYTVAAPRPAPTIELADVRARPPRRRAVR